METGVGNVSSDREKKNPEIEHEEGKPFIEVKAREFSSPPSLSSCSSSSSSFSSQLEFDIDETGPPDNVSTKPILDGNLSSSPDNVTRHSTVTSTEVGLQNGASEMQIPPIQTMEPPANYDPNRIPLSIFSTKPTTPTDNWSVASNESLFSIHTGNNSFSRDHASFLGKSEELPWLDEWSNSTSPNLHYVSEAKSTDLSSLPTVMEVPAHEECCEKPSNCHKLESNDSDKSLKSVPEANVDVHLSASATSPSLPRLSDESGNSSSSFAFPVLVTDGGKSRSLKVVAEGPDEPQIQSSVSKASSDSSKTRWYSYFSCWHRCC